MDLSKMSRRDLGALQTKLKAIEFACDALERGGLEPMISLSGEASMITMEPILSFGPLPEVELFEAQTAFPAPEPLPLQTAPDEVIPDWLQPRAAAALAVDELVEAATALPLPEPAAPIAAAAAPATPETRAAGWVTGPVTEAEKREIEALHLKGVSSAEIALRLKRHGSVVGTVIYQLKRRLKSGETIGPVPKAAPVQEAVSLVGELAVALLGKTADLPRAESAVIQKPGGERGELQQLANAEVAPVQSGAVGGPAPAAAPDEARPIYTGESKRIWDHIKGLGFPKGWDAELDHEICDAFGRGTKLDRLALDLDVDAKLIRDRYAALTACIRDDRGRMSIDGLERLVRLVRDRVKAERAGMKAA